MSITYGHLPKKCNCLYSWTRNRSVKFIQWYFLLLHSMFIFNSLRCKSHLSEEYLSSRVTVPCCLQACFMHVLAKDTQHIPFPSSTSLFPKTKFSFLFLWLHITLPLLPRSSPQEFSTLHFSNASSCPSCDKTSRWLFSSEGPCEFIAANPSKPKSSSTKPQSSTPKSLQALASFRQWFLANGWRNVIF